MQLCPYVSPLSGSFNGGTVTSPILFPNGTKAAPSVSFANATGVGLYWRTGTFLSIAGGGVEAYLLGPSGMSIPASLGFGTGSQDFSSAPADTFLVRDAADVLAMRDGATAQTLRVYNTYTDGSNYERGFMRWSSNVLEIGSEAGGTGASRVTKVASASSIDFAVAGTTSNWRMASTAFLALQDNTLDIGASGATRPRSGYFGTSVTSPVYSTSAPVTETGTTHTVAATTTHLITNNAGAVTVTLPAAASFTGRQIWIRAITNGTVVSASSNVVPQVGGSAGTAIIGAVDGGWAFLVSDGTAWQVMASSAV